MTLREARCRFTHYLAQLILFAEEMGYEVALDEAMDRKTLKDPTTDHMPGSLHEVGLAADLNLYHNGEYLSRTEDHQFLGTWWESLGKSMGLPLTWGGQFNDGNHYSYAWQGKK